MGEAKEGQEDGAAEILATMVAEQRTPILRELIIQASGVTEEAAQRVLDTLASAGMTIVPTLEYETYRTGSEGSNRLARLRSMLFPEQPDS